MKKFGGGLGVVLMVFVLVLAPMGTAKADNQKGWYVGLFAGYVIPGDLENDQSISLDNSYSLGIKGGYIIPQAPYIAVELEYNYNFAADVETQTITSGGDSINITGDDVKVQALMANLLFRYPGDWIRPYIGFGLGWSWIDGTVTGGGESLDVSDNAWAWQFLVGVNFAFAKNWSADLGYRYVAAENFSYTDSDGTDSDVKYTNSTIFLGINYHF
jgi:outer membrane autotransporter protein